MFPQPNISCRGRGETTISKDVTSKICRCKNGKGVTKIEVVWIDADDLSKDTCSLTPWP